MALPVPNPQFGELNSAEHSNEPESLEPENLNGLDLITKNNQNLTKPNVIKKLVGPYKGIAFRGDGDQPKITKQTDGGALNTLLTFVGANDLHKIRIRIPELHSHLPELGDDLTKVPATVASMYPEFIAESTDVKEPDPGTIVWCNFLDRENFKDPVYLGPVDDKKTGTSGGASGGSSANLAGGGSGLAGSPGRGDPFGGTSYKNASGQVSYPAISGSWTGELPRDGFTATTATVEDLARVALAQVGKKEKPEGSNGGPEVGVFNGNRGEAWCAAGIAWCFRQIGAPLPGDKLPDPTPMGYNPAHSISNTYGSEVWAKKFGVWFQEPQAGDIVVYNTSADPKAVDSTKHVGLCIKLDGDIMETVEFNLSDQVVHTKQNWRENLIWDKNGQFWKKARYNVLGYARRPLPYSGVPGGQLVQAPSDRTYGPIGTQSANHPMYEIAQNGKSGGLVEMTYIEGTRKLYPKKYIRALNAMRQAYQAARGKQLTIVSAYRDVAQQKQLYDAYLARNKAPPQVAPPGYSLHNNGIAIDIEMSDGGVDYSGRYTNFTFNNNVNKEDVHRRAANGEFGPVAQWLVNNCGKYGFYWDGWSYRELWHYQLNVDIARAAGLIDS